MFFSFNELDFPILWDREVYQTASKFARMESFLSFNVMKELCINLLLAKASGKVAEGQKCLRQQISEQKKNKGFVAMQGVCVICKKRIKEGRFDLASKESLTKDNDN